MAIELLADADARVWLRHHGFPPRSELLNEQSRAVGPFIVPDRPAVLTLTARYLADWLSSEGGMFLLYETDIWPSAAFPFLYSRLLSPLTVTNTQEFVDEWPAFTFTRDDEVVLAGAMAISLYQYWGFLCFSLKPRWWVSCNHDDMLEAFGAVPELPWHLMSPKPHGE